MAMLEIALEADPSAPRLVASAPSAPSAQWWRWHWVWAAGSWLAVVGGWGLAVWLNHAKNPTAFVIGPEFTLLAFIYIAAQAIERFLEPITIAFAPLSTEEDAEKVKTKTAEAKEKVAAAKKLTDESTKKAKMDEAGADLEEAAKARALVEDKRVIRGLLFWACASILAFLISAYLGIYLLNAVTSVVAPDGQTTVTAANHPPRGLDILVTGLAIGGGSKPLHDLISRIQKAKEKDQDEQEATT